METPKTGYREKPFSVPTKRYCQILDLKDDSDLIRKYRKFHSQEEVWPEIPEGIRSIGILEMEIYLLKNRLVMIVETPLDFDWDEAFSQLARLPKQQEWEEQMAVFQDAEPGAASDKKWQLMERIFRLYE